MQGGEGGTGQDGDDGLPDKADGGAYGQQGLWRHANRKTERQEQNKTQGTLAFFGSTFSICHN